MENSTVYMNSNDSVISTSGPNGSNSTIDPEKDPKWSFEFSVTLACIMSVSAFCTVVGNSMVLMVIIRHRGMRTRTNLFLLNLAITDLLVGLFVEPFSITTLIQNAWIFGTGVCQLNGWMNSFCLITSFHTLMYISIHKYFSIVRPLRNPLKLTYIIVMMMSAWLWAAICSTLNMAVLVVDYKPGTSQCGPRYPNGTTTFIVHGVIQFTVMYIPATILVFCYVRMFMEIKKHSQRLRTNSTVEEDFILSQQKKVTMTLFIVLATFVMMALPYHLYATYTTIKADKTHFNNFMNPLAYMFLYLSSMCNPIIYAFRSPAFREGYKEILCQTPNYIVSDDYDQAPQTRRFSYFTPSLRRPSSLSANNRNMTQYAQNKSLASPKSPDAAAAGGGGEKQAKPKFYKQKSLFELLRSTRQSDAQSVVHRNGDTIIMKGGKIVSVRREGEGNPFLERLRVLKEANERGRDLAAGLAGSGRVMFSLVCDGVSTDEKNADVDRVLYSNSSCVPNQTEMEQYEENQATDVDSACNQNGIMNSQVDKKVLAKELNGFKDKSINISKVKYSGSAKTESCSAGQQSNSPLIVSQDTSSNKEKPTSFQTVVKGCSDDDVSVDKNSGIQNKANLPYLLTSCLDDSASGTSQQPPSVVIHVGDIDDILSVMPLTPRTREYLAKSDLHISQADRGGDKAHGEAMIFKALKISHSSEHILKRPPGIQRLPSLEFLDPPVHLFRSHSNLSMNFTSQRFRGRSKTNTKRDRSQSPDTGLSSKLSHSRSIISSRNNVTHL